MRNYLKKLRYSTLVVIGSFSLLTAEYSYGKCKKYNAAYTVAKKSQVYQHVPFSDGEEQYYELFYMGVFVGYGKLEVKEPIKHKGLWHNVFAASANTAPSYEVIFKGKEKMMTYSQPGSFSVTRFKLEQDEEKMLGDKFLAQKWLKFNHDKCYVKEILLEHGKKQVVKRFDLASGATDILSSFYQIRTRDFKLGKMEKFLIYTSEKSWWAEATPVKIEKVKVPSGEFKALKISMKTFIGKVAEQKGDMFVWIAMDHPSKPLVKIQGEVKIGKIELELRKFTPGKDQLAAVEKYMKSFEDSNNSDLDDTKKSKTKNK
jgi:hypothetical protein